MLSKPELETTWGFIIRSIVLIVLSIGLVVPLHSARRNIDIQGLILILGGLYGAVSLLWATGRKLDRIDAILLTSLLASCALSLFSADDVTAALFGGLRYRVGALGLVSCMTIGLALSSSIDKLKTVWILYMTSVALCIVAIPYNIYFFGYASRLYGTLYNPDVLAIILGCGFLLGMYILQKQTKLVAKPYLWLAQSILLFDILLTESRATLLFLPLIALSYFARGGWTTRVKAITLGISLVTLLILTVTPSRVMSLSYFGQSVIYRVHLQSFALEKVTIKPLGYGAGNLFAVFDCRDIKSQDLSNTCRQGIGFDSSHNLFTDRFLEYGWLGGISFFLITIRVLFMKQKTYLEQRVLRLSFLLLVLYSFTNVSGFEIELFYWILAFGILSNKSPHVKKKVAG